MGRIASVWSQIVRDKKPVDSADHNNDITNLFASSFNIMIGLRNFGLSTTYHDSFVYVERMNANKTKPQQAGKAYLELQ